MFSVKKILKQIQEQHDTIDLQFMPFSLFLQNPGCSSWNPANLIEIHLPSL